MIKRTGGEVRFPSRCAVCVPLRPLSRLRYEVAHGLGGLVLLLAGGVGVRPQREPGVIMPQHDRDRFDVHTVLEGQGGEGVAEIVEPEVLQPGVFQDALVQRGHRVRYVLLWFRVRVIL